MRDAFSERMQMLSAPLPNISAWRRARRAIASIGFNGDYGLSGPNPRATHGVFNVSASINFPIWSGGRTRGEIAQAEATLRHSQTESVARFPQGFRGMCNCSRRVPTCPEAEAEDGCR
jgi:hypothetical protein